MTTSERLEELYRRWWEPRWRPPISLAQGFRLAQRVTPRPPPCGSWLPLAAPIPTTARWALVCIGGRPYYLEGDAHGPRRLHAHRIRYAKSHASAVAMFDEIALRDHPHTSLVPVSPTDTAALRALLRRQGLQR
jgi:hypothetical protein